MTIIVMVAMLAVVALAQGCGGGLDGSDPQWQTCEGAIEWEYLEQNPDARELYDEQKRLFDLWSPVAGKTLTEYQARQEAGDEDVERWYAERDAEIAEKYAIPYSEALSAYNAGYLEYRGNQPPCE